MTNDGLPVAVIGAGPVGLAAAVRMIERGLQPLVLEAGPAAGSHIRQWGHVRLFSPWKHNMDGACRALLVEAGWTAPDPEAYPTGNEFLDTYLLPLTSLPQIAPYLQVNARVEAVARQGRDKVQSASRADAPFLLRVRTASGARMVPARAVIDASGTWSQPNPVGPSGIALPGEEALSDRIHRRIPDVAGRERAQFAGVTTLVLGSGDSALTVVANLAGLAADEPGTRMVWAVRRERTARLFGGGSADQLPERGRLGLRARELVESGALSLRTGFRVESITEAPCGRLRVRSEDGRVEEVDRVVASTGFRPQLSLLRELRLDLDGRLECPAALAPLIDPELHSCGTVPPHGAGELAHPERDFYIVGMKSYGRAPTFLLLTGYEQVRSVVAALAGDRAEATAVELHLPETGVCVSEPADTVERAAPVGPTCCTA